jgi:dTDP-4-dehydrorhamnose reductase
LDLRFAARPEIDLLQPGSLAAAIRRDRPDAIVNAAAYTAVDQAEDEPDLARRLNVEAAGEAAIAAAEVGASFVQISTDYVFDGNGSRPYGEHDPVRPLGVYGRTKLGGEERVRAAGGRFAILRTSWLYSPFGRNFVRTMMNAAKARPLLTVVDDQFGTPTSALELADAILALIDRGQVTGGTYHVAGTGTTSWCGLAREVMAACRSLGLPAAEVRGIRTEDWPTRAERPRYSALDSGRFAEEVGFVMPPWQASVAQVVRQIAGAT